MNNLFQMIIDSGERDEVAALLRSAMGLEADETLCRNAVGKFLDEQEVKLPAVDAQLLRLYLEDHNLLEKDISED